MYLPHTLVLMYMYIGHLQTSNDYIEPHHMVKTTVD